MSVNLITKYAKSFEKKMRMESLVFGKGLNKMDFTGANTVKSLTPVTQTPNDYNPAATGSRFGTLTELQDVENIYTLQYSKSNNISIDKQYNTEQMQLKRAFEMMKEEIEQEYVPMMDKHALAVYAGTTGVSTSTDGTITGANAFAMFTKAKKAMVNAKTFNGGKNCVAWVSSTVLNDAVLDSPKFLNLEKIGNKALVEGACGKLAGYSIIEVPDDYMPTNVNAIFANLKVCMNPIKFKTLRILSEHPDVDGAVLQPHFRYGVFVEKTNVGGIHVSYVQ